jgi:putative transposase
MWANPSAGLSKGCGQRSAAVHSPACPQPTPPASRPPHRRARPPPVRSVHLRGPVHERGPLTLRPGSVIMPLIKIMPTQGQLHLPLKTTWGGRREGAGRPRLARRRAVAHRARPEHKARFPVHVTLRARRGLPSLRGQRLYGGVQLAIAAASRRDFRIVHFSVQSDHLHLLVEAADARTLSSGVQGLAIRGARAINKLIGRRGAVWSDRYHARPLSSPREVRHGLVYVLMNFRKHRPADRSRFDACSSAAWFDGFVQAGPTTKETPPVAAARTWLGSVGWRRHGLIRPGECPVGPARSAGTQLPGDLWLGPD